MIGGLRVALLSAHDPRDARSGSGIPFHMARALEAAGAEVVPVAPLAPVELRLAQGLSLAARALGGRRRAHAHSWLAANGFARKAAALMERAEPDVVLASAGGAEVAALAPGVPVVACMAATFRLLVEEDPAFAGLSAASLREGDRVQRAALDRASFTACAAERIARSAAGDYDVPAGKLAVAPMGPCLDQLPSRERALEERPADEMRLVFMGRNWRDGGGAALETLAALRAQGVPATLTVCGATPPGAERPRGVRVIPALDRRRPRDGAILARLLHEAHAMLLFGPRAHSPGAVADAAAYGLPVVAVRAGDAADLLVEEKSGILLAHDAPATESAEALRALWSEPARLARMRRDTRARHDALLNWDAWTRVVGGLMRRAVDARVAPPAPQVVA